MVMQSTVRHTHKLSKLLDGFVDAEHFSDVMISGVSEFSGDINQGDLFLATASKHHHGLMYCEDAISNGAVAVAWEPSESSQALSHDLIVPNVSVNNLSSHVSEIARRCYGDVSDALVKIAITGTDGKSSVAYLTAQALAAQHKECGLIGTLGYGRLSDLSEANHTTPPITRLQKELSEMAYEHCEYVAIEASSHGIDQSRLQNIRIHTAVLTNITRDHLDYHATVEEYVAAKEKLFFTHQPKHCVINVDDQLGREWAERLQEKTKVWSYALNNTHADVYANSVSYNDEGTTMDVTIGGEKHVITTSLLGEFNVLNFLAVAAILLSLEIDERSLKTYLEGMKPVPGRMQLVRSANAPKVVIDYAHTPNALSAAIDAVRSHYKGKLICVFGCGGDRDQGKRELMGKVVSQKADYTVVTSDNPRHEDPQRIIDEVLSGCDLNQQCVSIIDRKAAIQHAIKLAKNEDVVLIAGKGHEKFQTIGSESLPFDDVSVAEQLLGVGHNG